MPLTAPGSALGAISQLAQRKKQRPQRGNLQQGAASQVQTSQNPLATQQGQVAPTQPSNFIQAQQASQTQQSQKVNISAIPVAERTQEQGLQLAMTQTAQRQAEANDPMAEQKFRAKQAQGAANFAAFQAEQAGGLSQAAVNTGRATPVVGGPTTTNTAPNIRRKKKIPV